MLEAGEPRRENFHLKEEEVPLARTCTFVGESTWKGGRKQRLSEPVSSVLQSWEDLSDGPRGGWPRLRASGLGGQSAGSGGHASDENLSGEEVIMEVPVMKVGVGKL